MLEFMTAVRGSSSMVSTDDSGSLAPAESTVETAVRSLSLPSDVPVPAGEARVSSPAGRQSEHTTGPHRHEAAAPAVIGLLKPDMVLLMEAVELQLVLQKETAVRVGTADTGYYILLLALLPDAAIRTGTSDTNTY